MARGTGYTDAVSVHRDQAQIETLRRYRAGPGRDLTMRAELMRVREEAARAERATRGLGLAWDQIVPGPIAEAVWPVTLTRGVLMVRARDSAARYLFDQWLRAGGLALLRERATRTLNRVKIV